MHQNTLKTIVTFCAKTEVTLWMALLFSIFVPSVLKAAQPEYVEGRILIKPKPGRAAAISTLHSKHQTRVLGRFDNFGGIQVVELPAGVTVPEMVEKYQASGEVEFAEPDHIVHLAVAPNETAYTNGNLWHLNNLLHPGADIHAAAGWDTTNSATNIIVAIVDTGIRYTHQDLLGNMWTNSGEFIGNDSDNDGDGIKTNLFGINAANYPTLTGDPMDFFGHGTEVAGVIGALGNNGVGVCGVAWGVKLMACKFLEGESGSISGAAVCIDFARTNGAKIINLSFNTTSSNKTLFTAITNCRAAGIIVVAAAGNLHMNNDRVATYPANFKLDNIVSVAATAQDDTLPYFSNYGATNVDLAAPGTNIYSTSADSDSSYAYADGTSFSAPCVAGAVALMWARFPDYNYHQIINRLLWTTDPLPSLTGKCITGGRLNLARALNPVAPALTYTPNFATSTIRLELQGERYQPYILQSTTNLISWKGVATNTASSAGVLRYTNNLTGEGRFYRAILGQ
jgi:subtilisin family serine protease